MSRSGYGENDDSDYPQALWDGVIASATRGKRGQRFFVALVAALDAMPVKELVAGDLEDDAGAVCALGSLGKAKGVDVGNLSDTDWDELGATFDIAPSLARETMYINDEGAFQESEQHRWERVRAWAAAQVRP